MFQTAIVTTGTAVLYGVFTLVMIMVFEEARLILNRSDRSETENE